MVKQVAAVPLRQVHNDGFKVTAGQRRAHPSVAPSYVYVESTPDDLETSVVHVLPRHFWHM